VVCDEGLEGGSYDVGRWDTGDGVGSLGAEEDEVSGLRAECDGRGELGAEAALGVAVLHGERRERRGVLVELPAVAKAQRPEL